MSRAALDAVLAAEDRTPIEGADPIVSVHEDDDAEYVAALEEYGLGVHELERRGHWHGRWVELDPELEPRARLPRPAICRRRVLEARPLVLRGAVSAKLSDWRNELFAADRALESIGTPAGFEAWIRARLGRGSALRLERVEPGGVDAERDVATAHFVRADGSDGPRPWAKVGRLSTHDGDASLRLRTGFGNEPDDDANPSPPGQRATLSLARALLPELALVNDDKALFAAIDEVSACDEPLGPACPIAYWNRPGGGALFHHDAFEAVEGPDRQFGVLYVQLAGATAWLALSTTQLARRLEQFAAALDEGEVPWLREQLGGTGALEALETLRHDRFALLEELGLPGQGRLGALVNRGPEFTAFLADLGHAAVLRAGDAILLPNNGWRSTALHSVYCASNASNYALSLGLRPRRQVGSARRR
ncbi:hypothetical protein Pla163_05560 [Planctomycetes bacterium Pla163]|uniref:Uncharacterized protein n=1 Tax=Rohdeia mirabilis TaxID=2528008 RepID=A0A518CW50_9BACT|nr:hypothetical protein Pla163_05560 [Planctomycetes bacterium Pla163]